MKLYKGTGCHVRLIGTLKAIPTLEMDSQGEFFTTIDVNINTPQQMTSRQYNIVVLKETALRMRQYGFPGVYLLIEGFLTVETNLKIIAEKIIFLDDAEPNTSNLKANTYTAQLLTC